MLGFKNSEYSFYWNFFGFFLTGILIMTFSIGLVKYFKNNQISTVGPLIQVVSSIAFAANGVFPFDSENLSTPTNTIHIIMTIGSLSLGGVSGLVTFLSLRKADHSWKKYKRFILITGILPIIGLTMFIFPNYLGLLQRISLSSLMMFVIVFSLKIRPNSKGVVSNT